ncbi:MAG: sulfurtransferase [Nitrospirae bacterium]|nr:sulfurtransferase [Nitrospirota bacterium]
MFRKKCYNFVSFLLLMFTILFPLKAIAGEYPNASLLIGTEWLAKNLDDPNIRIVDLRSSANYMKGHIKNAIPFSHELVTTTRNGVKGMVADKEAVEQAIERLGIGPNTKVIFYDDADHKWAAYMFWVMEYHGHKNVGVLNGGFQKWEAEKRSLSSDIPKINPVSFKAKIDKNRIVDTEWVKNNLKNPKVKLINVQPQKDYIEGHIAGAISIPWMENLQGASAKVLKSKDELMQMYEKEEGIKKDDVVISSCMFGILAGGTYFTLRLLDYKDVRLYDGSKSDWVAKGNPVKTGKER